MVTAWPDASDLDLPDAAVWDRQAGESTKAYGAFRIWRDLPPTQRRMVTVAQTSGISERRVRSLAVEWDWRGRSDAWDDACHRVEDRERLEAIRSMHAIHRAAGRAAMHKAVQALGLLSPENMAPGTIARLMELGAKLERSTLIVSVEELQGIEVEDEDAEDPWERIARELDPGTLPDL
jgi:hypothetical protein